MEWRGRIVRLQVVARAASCMAGLLLATHAGPTLAGPTGEPDPELRAELKHAIAEADSFDDRYDAEVWLVDMSTRLERYIPDPEERIDFLKLVHKESARANIPPELTLAVIQVESSFKQFAVSGAGARGYMQIMPFWLKEIAGPGENLFHPKTNIRMGCTILRYYLDKEHGQLRGALARYNGSYGRPDYPDLVIRALSRHWARG